MKSLKKISALMLAHFLVHSAAAAGGLSDQIMVPELFLQTQEGEIARYSLQRWLAPEPNEGWAGQGRGISLPENLPKAELVLQHSQRDESAKLSLELIAPDTPPRLLTQMPLSAPNPLLLFWLENIVRVAAVQTGGSPFYFRSAIREAIVAADLPQSEGGTYELILQPFAQTSAADRQRLGAFAELTLSLHWAGDDPARLLSLKAEANSASAPAGGYFEHLILKNGE